MSSKTIILVFAVLLAVALVFTFAGKASAQADDQVTGDTKQLKSEDKTLSQKKTVSDSLSNRKLGGDDESKGPSKFQMGLGIGSCFVMIAVVKWL